MIAASAWQAAYADMVAILDGKPVPQIVTRPTVVVKGGKQ